MLTCLLCKRWRFLVSLGFRKQRNGVLSLGPSLGGQGPDEWTGNYMLRALQVRHPLEFSFSQVYFCILKKLSFKFKKSGLVDS